MARPSKMKTPKTPAMRHDEDESLLSTRGVGQSGDLGRGGGDEGDTELLQDSPAKHTRSMGANYSAEEASEVVRATAAEINKRQTEVPRSSSGKLRRVSGAPTNRVSLSNPPYQNPTRGIRKLGPSLAARPSTYAVDISPDKDPRKRVLREVEGATGISPLRKQKPAKAVSPSREYLEQSWSEDQERANQQLVAQQLQVVEPQPELSSPRRSKRQQEKELSTQEAQEKQWFPEREVDPASHQTEVPVVEEAEPQAELGAEEKVEVQQPVKPSPRKRGRPKKGSSATAQQSINVNSSEQPRSPEKSAIVQQDEAADKPASARPGKAEKPHGMGDNSSYQPQPADDDDEEMQNQEGEDGLQVIEAASNHPPAQPPKGPIVPTADMGYSEVQSSPAKPASPKKPIMRQKKRKADEIESRSKHAANSSKKVRPNHEPEAEAGPSTNGALMSEDEMDEAESDVKDADAPAASTSVKRFYGQWRHLRDAFKAVNDIGVNHHNGVRLEQRKFRNLQDETVNTIINVCHEAIEKLEEHQEVAQELTEIAERTDALHKDDGEGKINFDSSRRIKAIYAKLVPKLLAVLRKLVETYEERDSGRCADNTVTKGHLTNVVSFLKVITDLEEGAKQFAKPPTELALAQPNISIYAALKKAETGLQRELYQTQLQEDREEEARIYREQLALDEAQEEEAERIRAEHNKVRRAWNNLHAERLWAEGGIMSLPKQRHLRVPELTEELDQNGQPFIREQVFHPRIGPPPALVQKAKDKVWSMVQIDALDYGLRKYSGPHVLVKLMRESCGKGGAFNEFSVTEIVTTAAMYKSYMADLQMKERGEVEEWVQNIPVWIGGQGTGQENVGGDGA